VTPVQLYDAGVGDVIEIPTHHPRTVTVTGWEHAAVPVSVWLGLQGDLCRLSWTAPGGWRGATTLSDATVIDMVSKAGPDNPARKQYEADLEAALAALLDTVGEG
jgi:hypothetical protein